MIKSELLRPLSLQYFNYKKTQVATNRFYTFQKDFSVSFLTLEG